MSNYATKKDLTDITHVHVSGFASKTNLANLKTNIDTNDFAVNSEFNSLETKVDSIDLSNYLLKNYFNKEKIDIENKIPTVSGYATKLELAALDQKIPDVSNLATKIQLTNV